MAPFDCKWCVHFGLEGSSWGTREPGLRNIEVLECRLRSAPIPMPAYTFCSNFIPEDEREKLTSNETPIGPIWICDRNKSFPRVPYPYGDEFNDDDFRLLPVPDWVLYLSIKKNKREDLMRNFLLGQMQEVRVLLDGIKKHFLCERWS